MSGARSPAHPFGLRSPRNRGEGLIVSHSDHPSLSLRNEQAAQEMRPDAPGAHERVERYRLLALEDAAQLAVTYPQVQSGARLCAVRRSFCVSQRTGHHCPDFRYRAPRSDIDRCCALVARWGSLARHDGVRRRKGSSGRGQQREGRPPSRWRARSPSSVAQEARPSRRPACPSPSGIAKERCGGCHFP
jgi:hypothetical protein